MSSRWQLREAAVADAAALAELAVRAFRETFDADNTPADMQQFLADNYRADLQQGEIENPAMQTLLADTSEGLAGYAQLLSGPAPACVGAGTALEIKRFYVLAAWHGSGLAREIMADCLARARHAGVATVWLGVWQHNDRAKAFYARYGFEPCGSQSFWLGSDEQTDMLLRLAL